MCAGRCEQVHSSMVLLLRRACGGKDAVDVPCRLLVCWRAGWGLTRPALQCEEVCPPLRKVSSLHNTDLLRMMRSVPINDVRDAFPSITH